MLFVPSSVVGVANVSSSAVCADGVMDPDCLVDSAQRLLWLTVLSALLLLLFVFVVVGNSMLSRT